MKPDFCRLRPRIAAWGFRPGLWLGLCLCLFCCSVLPARALELVDSRGVTVRLERPAQRIIALYGAFNEILLALDARETLVARTAADAAIPGLQDLPAVGTHMRPNAELVAARQPDVVLQLAGRQEVLTQTEALEAVAEHLFARQGLEELFCCHAVENPASGAVQRKVGFCYTHDGVYHKYDGTAVPCRCYRLTKKEFYDRTRND